MNRKEIKEKIKTLRLLHQEEGDQFYDEHEKLVLELFEEKQYGDIVEIDKIFKPEFFTFEVAYSYSQMGDEEKAEEVYEAILSIPVQSNNSAVLNNLSNIKKEKGQVKKAFDLIRRAKEVDSNDEIINRNYQSLLEIVNEQESIDQNYKCAVDSIQKENEFVINKLKNFYTSIKKEPGYKNGQIAIPNWKFKVLMQTDEQKAESLKRQWIQKAYIRKTDERVDNFVQVYEVNKYMDDALEKVQNTKICKKWIVGFEGVNIPNLEKIGYFEVLIKIRKVNKKYKYILERDYNELVFNYLIGNEKSIIILAGSLIEALLIYYCEKKKMRKISYQAQNKTIQKDLYDCDLGDLLSYIEQSKEMNNLFVHLGNISRIHRNFIHSGKEIREYEKLDHSKSELCYLSAMEIIRKII